MNNRLKAGKEMARRMMDGEFRSIEPKNDLLFKVGHLERHEMKKDIQEELSYRLFTLIEAGTGTGKSSLVAEIAKEERAKGRTVVHVSLKNLRTDLTLDDLFKEDWDITSDALKSISKDAPSGMTPLIIIDDIQKLFDKKDVDADAFCSPLLYLYEQGIVNVIFVSSDGSVYKKMKKFSGFTERIGFYDWKRVSPDEMCKYVTEISGNELIQQWNPNVNATSARIFAENFDGWFTGLSKWVSSKMTIEEYIAAKRRELSTIVDELFKKADTRQALMKLLDSKDSVVLPSYLQEAFEKLVNSKLVQLQNEKVSFNYPFIKTVVDERKKRLSWFDMSWLLG